MVDKKRLAIRIFVIVVAIATAYVLYAYVLKPKVFEPLCLIGTNGCVRIGYYTHENSALAHLRGSGIWVWYNGDKVFVYGQPVGQICKDPDNFEAAYAIDPLTGLQEGYHCVKSLGYIKDFYRKRSKLQFLYKNVGRDKRQDFGVFDLINLLQDHNIINVSKPE